MDKDRSRIGKNILIVLINALVFLSTAFYNKFPLLDWDSGTYILSGYNGVIPWDRPILYGLLLRLFSFGISLWCVVFIQAILLSYLLLELIKKLTSVYPHYLSLVIVLVLNISTSVGIHAGFIMADITTALSFLLVLLLLLESNRTKVVLYSIGLIAMLPGHLSNVYSVLVFVILVAILKGLRFFKTISWTSILRIPMTLAISVFFLTSINFLFSGEVYISKASHVFFMGRLSENGILKSFLDKNCDTQKYKICKYKDSLPDQAVDFLFLPNSPLNQEGGWAKNKVEYSDIIKKTFQDKDLLMLHMKSSSSATLKQFFEIKIPDGYPSCDEGSPPFEVIKMYLPFELNGVRESVQYSGKLSFVRFNMLHQIMFVLSLVLVVFYLGQSMIKGKIDALFYVACFVLLLLLSNAFVCGTFANVVSRLQNRISWMLVFVASMVVYSWGTKLYWKAAE